MRILTPTEQREVQKLKNDLAQFVNPDCGTDLPNTLTIEIPYEKREMWLNVLDMTLQTNDALVLDWRHYGVMEA